MTATPDIPGLRISHAIGEGGFATVYRGWQVAVGREVAVKVDNRVLLNERDRRRFVREVTAAGRLSEHPHVVGIYDAGTLADGRPYMVMEFCPEGSLADAVRRNGVLDPAQVRDIGINIADALAAAHAAGVLHRDVKPANILVNRYGIVGLADFGLASIVTPWGEQSVTREALTPAYASPERFRGYEPTAACDLYSLAATLYALLTSRPPRFPANGQKLSIATIVMLHAEPVDDIPGVPPALMATLRRTLAADPAARPRSAEELRDELRAVTGPPPEFQSDPERKTFVMTGPRADRAVGQPPARSVPAATARHARRDMAGSTVPAGAVAGRRRPKALFAALAAACAVVIAAGAFLGTRFLSPDPHPSAPPTTSASASASASTPLSPEAVNLIDRVGDNKNFTGCDIPVRPVAGAKATINCQAIKTPGISMTASSFAVTGPAIPFNPDEIAGESSGLNAYLNSIVPGIVPPVPTGLAADQATPCNPQANGTCPDVGFSGFWGSPSLFLGRLYCYQKPGRYYIAWTFDNDEYEAQHNEDFAVVVSGTSQAALLNWWRTTAGL